MKVIGYVRISKDANGNGHSLDAQRAAIEGHCSSKGWELVRIEEDISSGKKRDGRPGFNRALDACQSGEANCLVAAKLDRLTRSLLDFAKLVADAKKHRYDVVVIDQSFDLSTSHGKAMAGMLAIFAEWERDQIIERTKKALAQAKKDGVKLGNPHLVRVSDDVVATIQMMRDEGRSYRAIADSLTEDGIATAQGASKWSAETVRKIALRSP